ncbi:hypothetical protein H4R99_001993 [Coemansia sp. RSA 1722]|nr:hypothetical protein H4R99_001993 [Coemansia sp. RSA 1722]
MKDTLSTLFSSSTALVSGTSLPLVINSGVSASTITSIWTILPPDISVNNPTVVMQLQQPDSTVIITAQPVTVTGATVTQTGMPVTEANGGAVVGSASPVTSFVTAPPSMTTSISTVIETTTETGSLATMTSTFTMTETYTPPPVTANADIVTQTSLETQSTTLTSLVTITPSPVYSTITFGTKVLITVYSSIKVAAPPTILPTSSELPSTTPEEILPTTPPPEEPPQEQQPVEQQPPPQEQQPVEQSSRSVICSWKVIGGRTIYRCHYSDEPWW